MGYTRISRASFYRRGGFSNPNLVRVTRGGSFAYFARDRV